ncbi:MAG: bifunctional phosphoribosyl-AMP cyclohydrolase/phosphoribosyl-ATP diphosphatase HisIE [Arcobacter butzleri]|jgi:phosphoribosyl-ATP pyrophosphohydrolase/phosphoribosyl-AMP cyclohydrolase|nr:bifunctional phosphoribosyl-AMP cyclohydrolase/phosphoribosyl-ATP diphosphatase HisIE [Arcobacteraceae bacterium]MDY0364885.1 bifunctional phosphoribosyl-AMP cyclohydrolase/phosphoribosyl-ATP diphosphatase HisIE [Arcobacteraceae bacterium]NLO18221.1 bifunctional phosphoribosyl-AMP cyclohydrolase/phosphoribosyl-ATP diphosphatase HisIE [Aliarcobacter butzleri]
MDFSKLDWDKGDGLIPVITQDYESLEVLMLGYTDKKALELTISTNEAHYYSRSKQRLWKKGETSGHIQKIKEIFVDCDDDTILFKVEQIGVACHTGRKNCFFKSIDGTTLNQPLVDMSSSYGVVDTLYHTILDRKKSDPTSSYTAKLLQGDENSMLKKIVEEAGEFTFAYKDDDIQDMIYEAADLTYHMLVAMASKNISPDRIKQELARRFGLSGIEEKNSRG